MTMYGASPEELRRIAGEIERTADDLDESLSGLTRLLVNVVWLGEAAMSYLGKWTGLLVPKFNFTTAFLRDSAVELRRQASEQESASNAYGQGAAHGMGSLGGTFDVRHRGTWSVDGTTNIDVGRNLLIRSLEETVKGGPIDFDEFEIVTLDNGNVIVVLPGSIDLDPVRLNWDPISRSIRDTDMGALMSSRSALVDDNLYAQYVIEAMRKAGVKEGSNVMLIGHSYGADTALDLASDPTFNGETYHVTHAVAAAYNSEHQLASVPASTRTLVIQNTNDLVIVGEATLHDASQPIVGAMKIQHGVATGDPGDIARGIADVAESRLRHAIPFKPTADALSDLARVSIPGEYRHHGHDRIVFDGGTETVGHHQSNYIDYLRSTSSPATTSFFEDVAANGYGAPGYRTTHDVSVPESGHPFRPR